jgi:hypothetical protein
MNLTEKTFCASPGCTNKCGRKMTHKEKMHIRDIALKGIFLANRISYAYFCGEPESIRPQSEMEK